MMVLCLISDSVNGGKASVLFGFLRDVYRISRTWEISSDFLRDRGQTCREIYARLAAKEW